MSQNGSDQGQTRQRADAPLGTLIFRAGLVPADQLEDALEEGVRRGRRLGEILLERGLIEESDLARILAGQKGLPYVDPAVEEVDPAAAQLLSEDKARLYRALPVRIEEGVPVVAIIDPTNEVVVREVTAALGQEPRFAVAAKTSLVEAIARVYGAAQNGVTTEGLRIAGEPESEPSQEEPSVEAEPVFASHIAPFEQQPQAEPEVPLLVPEVERAAPPAPPPEPSTDGPAAVEPAPAAPLVADAPPGEPALVEPLRIVPAHEPAREPAPQGEAEPALSEPPAEAVSAPEPELIAAPELPAPGPVAFEPPPPAVEWPAEPPAPVPPAEPVAVETPAVQAEPPAADRPSEPAAPAAPAAPVVAEPAVEPAAFAPAAPEAALAESGVAEPATFEPPAMEPVAVEPPVAEPVATEPVAAEPAAFEQAPAAPAAAEPVMEAAGPQAVEPPAEPLAPQAVEPAAPAGPSPEAAGETAGYLVALRLSNGERVEVAKAATHAEATEHARAFIRSLAEVDASGWPLVGGRFIRPDAIVSVDISERDRR
jgi:hypothetical protein